MPEGHVTHGLARDLRKTLGGSPVRATSPQGRFAEGAALVDGLPLVRTDAWGKYLFLDFGHGRLVHVHLGLIGKLRPTSPATPPGPGVRLRLENDVHAWQLSGPTRCSIVTPAEKKAICAPLGADPLRAKPDVEAMRIRMQRRRAPIGAVLLDQTVIAGIGNVYRAELLFLRGINPLRLGEHAHRCGRLRSLGRDVAPAQAWAAAQPHRDHRSRRGRPSAQPHHGGRPSLRLPPHALPPLRDRAPDTGPGWPPDPVLLRPPTPLTASPQSRGSAVRSSVVADALFEDPRLAVLYDPLDPDRGDLDVYVAMVAEFDAWSVLDIGCGTGTFACLLAETGRDVVGVDPAAASLGVARGKAGADRVRWIHSDATDLPAMTVDLVTMTGNVAQVFVDDDEWLTTLRTARRSLRRGGRLVFESREPSRRDWESWTKRSSKVRALVPGIGTVESWSEVTTATDQLVSFTTTFDIAGEIVTSESTLRFRTRDEIAASLDSAALALLEVRDAPDRPGLELRVHLRAQRLTASTVRLGRACPRWDLGPRRQSRGAWDR